MKNKKIKSFINNIYTILTTMSLWIKTKEFYVECVRVLKITRKPDKIEFKTIVKVSGLGIIIIGLIGFLISMIKTLTFG